MANTQTWVILLAVYFISFYAFMGVIAGSGIIDDDNPVVYETRAGVIDNFTSSDYNSTAQLNLTVWNSFDFVKIFFDVMFLNLDLGLTASYMWVIRIFFVALPAMAFMTTIFMWVRGI